VLAAGSIDLCRFSETLSDYLGAASSSQVKIYTNWVVGFGRTPQDVDVAVDFPVADMTDVVILAVEIPGAKTDLASAFGRAAAAEGRTVGPAQVGDRNLIEVVDPTLDVTTGHYIAYIYSKGQICYFIVTDKHEQLVSALIQLPH